MTSFMRLGAFTASHRIANTYGWDTVSALRVRDMNRTIAQTESSPEGFEHALEGQPACVKAQFGTWRIGRGGDGRLIHMELPLKNVNAAYNDDMWQGNLIATVEVQLHFLPHDLPRSTPDGAQTKRLMLCDQPANQDTPIAGVLHLADENGQVPENLGVYHRAVIKMCLQEWLCANLNAFTHVFATVNIHKNVGEEAFRWLKPTYASYYFLANPEDPEDSIFAILCRTGGRSEADLIEQLSPHAVPDNAEVAFLISPERMLNDMVQPSLPQAFKGLTSKQISFSEDDLELSATTSVPIKQIDHDGKCFEAKLEQLKISLRDREMIMDSTTSTEVSPGIYSVCRAVGFYNIGMITKPDGSKTIGYRESRAPEYQDWTRKSEGVIVLQWILSAISVIAGILAFVPGINAAAIPVLIIAALLSGGGLLSMKLIEAIKGDDAPPLDLLVANTTKAVTWANGEQFELTSVELNGALQLAGNFRGAALRL